MPSVAKSHLGILSTPMCTKSLHRTTKGSSKVVLNFSTATGLTDPIDPNVNPLATSTVVYWGNASNIFSWVFMLPCHSYSLCNVI